MVTWRKIGLHSVQGYRPEFNAIVEQWFQQRVSYVGVLGIDASRLEDIVNELCNGDGSNLYFMLTASHCPDETIEDASCSARQLSGEFAGDVGVVVSKFSFKATGFVAA